MPRLEPIRSSNDSDDVPAGGDELFKELRE